MPRGRPRLETTRQQSKKPLQCSALTHSFEACKNRATSFTGRHKLPLCWAHRKLGQTVTACQAVLKNNRKCLKKIPWSERGQLCSKHVDFILPCYILRLPTELRQHIFSYVLDEYKGDEYAPYYTYHSFVNRMFLNRQIFQEANDVLYRSLVCKIYIDDKDIYILGRKCSSAQPGSWQNFKEFRLMFNFLIEPGVNVDTVKRLATQIHGSNIKLHIAVKLCHSFLYFFRKTPVLYDTLPSYLDSFRHLKGVREASVTINPDPADRLKKIEKSTVLTSKESRDLASLLQWRRYYEEWVKDLQRGHSV